jgi:K+-sensing histidine kinase KdpD
LCAAIGGAHCEVADCHRSGALSFFRGDAARTAATGSGLGLAIVERSVQRMGGTFSVFNNSAGGLMALMKFRQAEAA